MHNQNIHEVELLSQKIEKNTATLEDYKRYENLLLNGGFTHDYIFSNLNRAGFWSWEEFIAARQKKEKDKDTEANIVGGLIGIGLGLLLLGMWEGKKK
ncbi:hypothetical protein [uncultured Flavobacterium sp.]|uniref:hypothetical protein n=1 Tax=uncultured Flavobacterium sp. TaxID=165435 RepID=UPI0030C7E582